MLEQMAVEPPGIKSQVIVTGSKILRLLKIRHNPNFLPLVKNGVYGGFFRFEDLNPDLYEGC